MPNKPINTTPRVEIPLRDPASGCTLPVSDAAPLETAGAACPALEVGAPVGDLDAGRMPRGAVALAAAAGGGWSMLDGSGGRSTMGGAFAWHSPHPSLPLPNPVQPSTRAIDGTACDTKPVPAEATPSYQLRAKADSGTPLTLTPQNEPMSLVQCLKHAELYTALPCCCAVGRPESTERTIVWNPLA